MGKCKVAFILNGGLGSILVGTEYIKKFYDAFNSENKLAVYAYLSPSKDVSDCIMKGANFVSEYYTHRGFSDEMKSKYDIVIEVVFFPYIHYIRKNLSLSDDMKSYLDKTLTFQKSDEMCRLFSLKGNVKQNIYEWGMLNNRDRFHIADPLNLLNISDEYSYTPNIYKEQNTVLSTLGLQSQKYITLQRGTNSGFSKDSVRDWPVSYYEELAKLLKHKYPQYTLVQLGESIENCEKIKGVDVCLLGKTDLEDIKVLLANSILHIDGECGMVHLRKALKGGPSIVFMGSEPKEFFGYQGNINMEIHPCGGYCHGLTNVWYKKCLKWHEPRCMLQITPKEVIKQIEKYFQGKKYETKSIKQTKLQEILTNKDIYLDKFWTDSWLRHQEIYAYSINQEKITNLYVNILFEKGWKKVSILESPVYKYVCGNQKAYEDYMDFKNLQYPDGNVNSTQRYDNLIKQLNQKYNHKSVVVVNGANVILDGQHRACWALHKFGKNAKIKVLKIYGSFGV